jgi:hypothetical protein
VPSVGPVSTKVPPRSTVAHHEYGPAPIHPEERGRGHPENAPAFPDHDGDVHAIVVAEARRRRTGEIQDDRYTLLLETEGGDLGEGGRVDATDALVGWRHFRVAREVARAQVRGGRNPARVTLRSRRTAALDGRLLAAVRAWRQ